jgi:hypothetical protein
LPHFSLLPGSNCGYRSIRMFPNVHTYMRDGAGGVPSWRFLPNRISAEAGDYGPPHPSVLVVSRKTPSRQGSGVSRLSWDQGIMQMSCHALYDGVCTAELREKRKGKERGLGRGSLLPNFGYFTRIGCLREAYDPRSPGQSGPAAIGRRGRRAGRRARPGHPLQSVKR